MDARQRYHFIGIGGIGMSGIAEILLAAGNTISGSDAHSSPLTQRLAQLGATIYHGHAAEQVPAEAIVVYSTAIASTNPEFQRALELGLPLVRRGQMLANLMQGHEGIAIAGSHGKTTTTAALAAMARAAGTQASFLIGGTVSTLGGNACHGKGKLFIAEADESDGSFLLLSPRHAIITNIDDDHLDHYGSRDQILAAFKQFLQQLPADGAMVLNIDDPACRALLDSRPSPVTFSCRDSSAHYTAVDPQFSAAGTSFRLLQRGKELGLIHTKLIGEHNLANTLGALALALERGWELDQLCLGLENFAGVDRRQQRLWARGEFLVMDDYAHHPTEIRATIAALKRIDSRPLMVVFEPHRFTRTQNFWDEFIHAFSQADQVFVAPIYPASETAIPGIDAERLVREMQQQGIAANFMPQLEAGMQELVQNEQQTARIMLTMGAGPISAKIRKIVSQL